jgi:hypothetical protein
MDPVIQQAPVDLLGHLDKVELAEFIRLLELARIPSGGSQSPVSCSGERSDDGRHSAGRKE